MLAHLAFPENQTERNKIFQRREVQCCLFLSPQSHRTVGSLWRESGLNWTDFLPEGEDIQAFISQQVGNKGLKNDQDSVTIHWHSWFLCNTRSSQRAHFTPTPSSIGPPPLSFFYFIISLSFVTSPSYRRPLVLIQTETPVCSVGRLQSRGGSVQKDVVSWEAEPAAGETSPGGHGQWRADLWLGRGMRSDTCMHTFLREKNPSNSAS